MPYTQQTQITCHKCGYPNHLAKNCTGRKEPPHRGAQNPFQEIQKTNYALQESKTQTCEEKPVAKDRHNEKTFIHKSTRNCAVFPLKAENLTFVRLKVSIEIKRRTLIDTGLCANALSEFLLDALYLSNSKYSTLEKHFFLSVRMASGQRVPFDKQAKISFQIGPQYFQDSFSILPTMNSVIVGNLFIRNIVLQSIQKTIYYNYQV